MPHFTTEQIRECMDHQDRIRNMSVIAHVDHGKSTLTDSLIAHAGIISMGSAGNTRFTDTRQDEKDRCITIKSTGVSLYYEWTDENKVVMEEAAKKAAEKVAKAGEKVEDVKADKKDKKKDEEDAIATAESGGYLINLIDSPGHVDFSSEVTAALRVTDGALVVVDCAEGVCVQTETVLRQALSERVIPCLMLNKVDRVIMELKLSGEDAFLMFEKTIGEVNQLIATYQDKTLFNEKKYKKIFGNRTDLCVDPSRGNVAFGSGLHGWGFTVTHFARIYTKKFGGELSTWMKNLWGNRFLNEKTGKWTGKSQGDNGEKNQRGFAIYVMDPILQLFDAVMTEQKKKYTKMLKQLNVTLTPDEEDMTGKRLLKAVMQKFLPAADALLEMIIVHLPSPKKAQQYRVDTLYTGPLDDPAAEAIRNCDPNGPLMLYVSKMVPTVDKSRFFAFGRVFSGVVQTGQKVHIMGPEYHPGTSKKDELFIKNIQRTILMMGSRIEQIDDVPCGNTVGLVGIDQYLVKSGTISTYEQAHSIKPMKFSVSPVVRVAVEPANPKDLPKLLEGMKRLDKSDPCVMCICDKDENQNIIAGAGELHLEICLKDLREDFCGGMDIRVSDPVVSYRETVTEKSTKVVMAKSANKHNRLYFEAEPISEEVIEAIKDGEITNEQDSKVRARILTDKYGWDSDEAKQIWSFGPVGASSGHMTNLILEATKGVQYVKESKEHIVSGFQIVCRNGVLAGEELVGTCFKLRDATFHADAIHRGAGQLTPATRRGLYAACLYASPMLMEPFYLVDILAPEGCMGGIYSTMSKRRGVVISEEPREGQPLTEVKAHLPVAESFGFDADLRAATSGQAFPQCVFSHYALIPSSPLQTGSQAQGIMLSIRKRKGMKEVVPDVSEYEDKL